VSSQGFQIIPQFPQVFVKNKKGCQKCDEERKERRSCQLGGGEYQAKQTQASQSDAASEKKTLQLVSGFQSQPGYDSCSNTIAVEEKQRSNDQGPQRVSEAAECIQQAGLLDDIIRAKQDSRPQQEKHHGDGTLQLTSAFEINTCGVEFFAQNSQFIFSHPFSCFQSGSNFQIPAGVFFCLLRGLTGMQCCEDHFACFIGFQDSNIGHNGQHAPAAQACLFAVAFSADKSSRSHELHLFRKATLLMGSHDVTTVCPGRDFLRSP